MDGKWTKGLAVKIALVGAGLVGGAVIATSVAASATTTSGSGSTASGTTASSNASTTPAPGTGHCGGHHAPGTKGTVTAVDTAANTVTIKTSAGTKTYPVTSSSDIDKNGEATLAALKAGDAVVFDTASGTSTIRHLHAGNLALDRPAGKH